MSTDFQILHQDDAVCAVVKPSGILVHRTPISTDRVFMVDLLRQRIGRRVWPAHRLDRATSGVLLFALTADAAAALGASSSAAPWRNATWRWSGAGCRMKAGSTGRYATGAARAGTTRR